MEIKGYKILKELNRGPITTVFLAEQIALQRKVLIKMLNTQWRQENDLVERFRREAIICARFQHQNIVSIYDVSTEPDNLYLITEFIEGQNLEHFVQAYHPIPVPMILFISREIINGLAYTHSQGVIHRDVKPSNIMISKDGKIKITDFGLAKTEDLSTLTVEGGTVGTPAFMSPEQAQGSPLTQQSDLFSLGTTFYNLAGGKSPFEAKNFAESIHKVLKHAPSPLQQFRPEIPTWYSELVEKLLNKNPKRRPANAASILKFYGFKNVSTTSESLTNYVTNPRSFKETGAIESPSLAKTMVRKSQMFGALAVVVFIIVTVLMMWNSDDGQNKQKRTVSLLHGRSQDSLTTTKTKPPPYEAQTVEDASPPIESVQRGDTSEQQAQSPEKIPAREHRSKEKDINSNAIELNSESIVKKPDSMSVTIKEPSENLSAPGKLFITCTPWADVYIDGRKIDTTPLLEPIMLIPGSHQLELKNPNYENYNRKISVGARQTDTLSVTLKSKIGFVDLTVNPWAKIYVNGEYHETTPLSKPISLVSGKYEFKLINPNYKTWIDSLEVVAGETLSRQIFLEKN